MKRTSVRYEVTPSYSYNAESARANQNLRKSSAVVLLVGLVLVGLTVLFIVTHI